MDNANTNENNMVVTYTNGYQKITITWDEAMFECSVDSVGMSEDEIAAFTCGSPSILEGAGFPGFDCKIS